MWCRSPRPMYNGHWKKMGPEEWDLFSVKQLPDNTGSCSAAASRPDPSPELHNGNCSKNVPTQKSFDQKEELKSAHVYMEWKDQVEASSCSQESVSLSVPATWTLLAKKITARSCICLYLLQSAAASLCFIRIIAWSPIGHLMSGPVPAVPVCC